MVNKFISDKIVAGNYKPNFNLLKNFLSDKNLLKNYRLKISPIEDKYTNLSSCFPFNSKNFEISEDNLNYFHEKKKISIVTKNNSQEKKIKIFHLDFVKNDIKKISLAKRFDFEKNVSCLEMSNVGFDELKFRKNYTAVGKGDNEIHIWETDNLLKDEPLFFLKNNIEESMINKISSVDNLNQIKYPKKTIISCLKWNPETVQFILEGSSNGSVKYWDINKGKKIFEFFLDQKPISSFNWRPFNRNEHFFLNGDHVSCFSDIRSSKIIHREFYEEQIKDIQWLNNENLYSTITTSGFIILKDIRFQKGNVYSKNINQKYTKNKIKELKFSSNKKNLMVLDNKGYLKNYFLSDFKIKKIKSEKIKDHLSKEFFWLDLGKKEVIAILDNNNKIFYF